jgi:hypothetical protein
VISRFILIFISLFILALPFEQPLLPYLPGILSLPFEGLSAFVGIKILGWDKGTDFGMASDSPALYLSIPLMLILSSTFAFIWAFFSKKEKSIFIPYLTESIAAYYLSMHLFAYGFSKIFKVQFFLPEPNTLFTPMGQLSKDLVFWSAMGSSYSYTVFAGIIEIIPALMLAFKKTRLAGAIIAFAVMLNVFFINIGFDISVKVFSAFLLVLSTIIIIPEIKLLRSICFSENIVRERLTVKPKIRFLNSPALKMSIVCFLILNAIVPYLKTGNFNDDIAERPYLHGAYEVNTFVVNGDSISALNANLFRWKRFFVHRRGYFIIQDMQEIMYDFKLNIDKNNSLLVLLDYKNAENKYRFRIEDKRDKLVLNGNFRGDSIYLEANKIDMRKIPLLKNEFHWMVK